MKKYIAIMILLLPGVAFGQNFQGMSESDMQNMMQQMQQFQTCIEQIDQSAMEEIDRRSVKMDAEIKSLCARGKRDEAQEKAIAWGKEVAADPAVQETIRCGEIMKGQVPDIPFKGLDKDYSSQHVCDME